jgi:uncharacterized membrane protein (UPF0127 family)
MDAKGKVLNVEVLKALDTKSVPASGPSQFVLEMKAGSFKRLGLKAGAILAIPKGLKGA